MAQTATLYRMATDEHLCPFGLKSKDLLERKGFEVDDHPLTSRSQTDAFMKKHGVETTPQTWIDGERIGGYEDLRAHFGNETATGEDETTYRPVMVIFAVAFLMALAASWAAYETVFTLRAFEWFIAISMCFLAVQKLQDVESFSTMFLNYDLLARRWVPYGYVYPYGEAIAGILMISGALIWIASPIALVIGTIGAISVFKAVYIDKREIKCACVGGNSNVPLGFISLTENLMMIAMGLWMLAKPFVLA
jgi:glutaredoxin